MLPYEGDPNAALAELQEGLQRIREGMVEEESEPTSFAVYSVSLMEEKVKLGEIKSAKTRESWGSILKLHLIPVFGDLLMDQVRRADLRAWMRDQAELIVADECKPATANSIQPGPSRSGLLARAALHDHASALNNMTSTTAKTTRKAAIWNTSVRKDALRPPIMEYPSVASASTTMATA